MKPKASTSSPDDGQGASAGAQENEEEVEKDWTKFFVWRVWSRNICDIIDEHLFGASEGTKLSRWVLGELILDRVKSTNIKVANLIDLQVPFRILEIKGFSNTLSQTGNCKFVADAVLFKLANNETVLQPDRQWTVFAEGLVAELFVKVIKANDLLIVWGGLEGGLDFTTKTINIKRMENENSFLDGAGVHLITIFHRSETPERDEFDMLVKDYEMKNVESIYHEDTTGDKSVIVEVIHPKSAELDVDVKNEDDEDSVSVTSLDSNYTDNSSTIENEGGVEIKINEIIEKLEELDDEKEEGSISSNSKKILPDNNLPNFELDNSTSTPGPEELNNSKNDDNEDIIDIDLDKNKNKNKITSSSPSPKKNVDNDNSSVEKVVEPITLALHTQYPNLLDDNEEKEHDDSDSDSESKSDRIIIIDELGMEDTLNVLDNNIAPSPAIENENEDFDNDLNGMSRSTHRKILKFADLKENMTDEGFMITCQILDIDGNSYMDRVILTATDGTGTRLDIKEYYTKFRADTELWDNNPTYDILIRNGNIFQDSIKKSGIIFNEKDFILIGFLTMEKIDDESHILVLDGKKFQFRKLQMEMQDYKPKECVSPVSDKSSMKSNVQSPLKAKTNDLNTTTETEESDSDIEFCGEYSPSKKKARRNGKKSKSTTAGIVLQKRQQNDGKSQETRALRSSKVTMMSPGKERLTSESESRVAGRALRKRKVLSPQKVSFTSSSESESEPEEDKDGSSKKANTNTNTRGKRVEEQVQMSMSEVKSSQDLLNLIKPIPVVSDSDSSSSEDEKEKVEDKDKENQVLCEKFGIKSCFVSLDRVNVEEEVKKVKVKVKQAASTSTVKVKVKTNENKATTKDTKVQGKKLSLGLSGKGRVNNSKTPATATATTPVRARVPPLVVSISDSESTSESESESNSDDDFVMPTKKEAVQVKRPTLPPSKKRKMK